jgi:hypothetical protein
MPELRYVDKMYKSLINKEIEDRLRLILFELRKGIPSSGFALCNGYYSSSTLWDCLFRQSKLLPFSLKAVVPPENRTIPSENNLLYLVPVVGQRFQ